MIPLALDEIGRLASGELRRGGEATEATGVTIDSRRVDLEIANLAKLANADEITFYTVDGKGLTAEGGTAANDDPLAFRPGIAFFAQQNAQSGLMTLAQETGGIAMVNSNDFDRGFGRVYQDASTYYSVGVNLSSLSGAGYQNVQMPDPNVPNGVIAAMWDDFKVDSSAAIMSRADDGSFTIEYRNVNFYDSKDRVDFSITLYDTGDIACWENGWNEYNRALGTERAKRAVTELACWVRAVRASASRRIEYYPFDCAGFCVDECMAISLIAASQHHRCPAMRACALALTGSDLVEPVIDAANAFADVLQDANQRLSQDATRRSPALLSRHSARSETGATRRSLKNGRRGCCRHGRAM